MRRLGLFVFYDKEGIVDRYIEYLLEKMSEYLDRLYVVCNGKLKEPEKLLRFTERIYNRPNIGFDAAAWQYLINEVVSREELEQFDELLLWNDTFYGPVFPLAEMFGKMDREDCDFWGISAHAKSADPMGTCEFGYWPAHIQTYFIAVRRKMFLSPCFAEYWALLPVSDSFEEVVGKNEAVFTKFFSDHGFRWKVYADMEDIDAREPAQLTHFMNDSWELLVRCRSPFYKKKNFVFGRANHLLWNNGSFLQSSFRYIADCTDYDETMIYENILRIYDINRVIDAGGWYELIGEGRNDFPEISPGKAAVFVFLRGSEHRDLFLSYLRRIPEEVDIFIGTDSHQAVRDLEAKLGDGSRRAEIQCVNPAGSGLGALLIAFHRRVMNYELIAFVHNEPRNPMEYYTGLMTALSDMWGALLGGTAYIREVIRLFDAEPYLGLLVPPLPVHSSFFSLVHHPWGISFDTVQKVMKRLGLNRKADPGAAPISFGNMFWCRREALRQLLEENWDYREFSGVSFSSLEDTLEHAIAKILPYIAQENGFYTKFVSDGETLRNSYFNVRALLSQMTDCVQETFRQDYGVTPETFLEGIRRQRSDDSVPLSHLREVEDIFLDMERKTILIEEIKLDENRENVQVTGCVCETDLEEKEDLTPMFFVKDPYNRLFVSELDSGNLLDERGCFCVKLPYEEFRFEELPYEIGVCSFEDGWAAGRELLLRGGLSGKKAEKVSRCRKFFLQPEKRMEDGFCCEIESIERNIDYLTITGYAFLQSRFHFEYIPEVILCDDSGTAFRVRADQVERIDIAARFPEVPFLYRTGFCAMPLADDLEKGHTYSIIIRMHNVFDEKKTKDIRTDHCVRL